MSSQDETRINREIRAREVRVITEDGENMIVSLSRALEMAEERGLDLVEVSPNAEPPVCRIMDYGKFQYDKQRRERKARKQQKAIEIKEIQLQPKTDDHHLGFKMRDARRWIADGMKVRVRVKFKGREIAHPEIGHARLQAIAEQLKDVAIVEQAPNMEGRSLMMLLAPAGESKKKS
ncbi:MAG: translation initiation factor IF-3 [Anaerolineae bacterium]|nr:translation initiation factor IF-3 [Anaerolineae bacterium]